MVSKMTKKTINRRELFTAAAKTSLAIGAVAATPEMFSRSARGESIVKSPIVIGSGDYQYEVTHQFPQLPSDFTWQTTHNVAVDHEDNLYVIHEGHEDKPEHPAIFVFDSTGKYIRSFGSQFQGGGHGIEVRHEGNEEFLYVTGYQQVKMIAKLTLRGEVVWERRAPKESGVYHPDETANPTKVWGLDRFMPTNFAFLDNGGFLLADGYGSFKIHQYDKDANWVSCFGGAGEGKGTFNLPHGLWIDKRDPSAAEIIVTDRSHNTLQRLTMDGQYIDTLPGFGMPANIDIQGDLMLVPELVARLSILGKDNQIVAQLGDDIARVSAEKGNVIRNDPSLWQDGKFVHPHDACFDSAGNIYVAEWVQTGRISKLRKV